MAGVAASPHRTSNPGDEETAEAHAAIPAEDWLTDAAGEFEIHTPGGTRAVELKLNEITAILVALHKSSMDHAESSEAGSGDGARRGSLATRPRGKAISASAAARGRRRSCGTGSWPIGA